MGSGLFCAGSEDQLRRPVASHVTLFPRQNRRVDVVSVASRQLVGWASAHQAHRPATTGQVTRLAPSGKRWAKAHPTAAAGLGIGDIATLVGWASAHQDHRLVMMGQVTRLAPSGKRWAKAHPTAAAGRGIGDIATTRRVGFSPPRPSAGYDGSGCSLGSERQRVGFSPPIPREGRNARRLLTKAAIRHRATCPVASH